MGTRLLVVDDDSYVREMISSFLEKEGYAFDIADGLQAALKLIEANDYGIMLIDKNMPGLEGGSEGGMDLLRLVKAQDPSAEVIMMTGYATIETAIEAMRLGAFDYIMKPFSVVDLRGKIKRLCEYRSFINCDDAIQIYKSIRTGMINLVEDRSAMTDNELDQALLRLNIEIDKLFYILKESERILLQQRESLTKIACLAEEFKCIQSDDSLKNLVTEICTRSNNRL